MKRFAVLLAIVCVIAMSVNPLPTAGTVLAEDACQDDGSLCAMLNLVPDLLNGPYDQVYYDNYAEHLKHFGFTTPTTFEGQDWDNFTAVSADFIGVGDSLPVYIRNWEERMGYSPFLIDQALAFQHLPDAITLVRGRFDQSSVESFWSQIGYTPNSVNGVVIWKLRGDYEQELLEHPLRDMPRYNYAVFVRDDVIAYSSTAMGINATFQTANGSAPSLAANTAIMQLLATVPPNLASTIIGSGEYFFDSSAWTLFGIIPGGPARVNARTGEPGPIPVDTPLKRGYASLVYQPGVDLNQKANAISNTFLSGILAKTERPYTDFFQDLNVTVDSSNNVVVVNFAPQPDNAGNLFRFLLYAEPNFLV